MEETKTTNVGKIQREKWSNDTISQHFLTKFFKTRPESPEEKDIKEVKLLRVLLSNYDKCCELLEKECENSETIKAVRKYLQWNKNLNSKCSIEEVTYSTEILLLEYEISVHDVRELEKKENKDSSEMEVSKVDEEKSKSEPSEDPARLGNETRHLPYKSKSACLESLIGMFFHAERIRAATQLKIQKLSKDGSNPTEKTDSSPGKVDSKTDYVMKRLNIGMEFSTSMCLLIRAALLLFKRLNPQWVKSEENASEPIAKRGVFAKVKVASSDSAISSDNPLSVASENSLSTNFSSGTEQYEASPVNSEAQDQSSMDVDP